MKNKYGIIWILVGVVASLLIPQFSAMAADKVVVIPLFSSAGSDNIPTVTSATGRVWMDRNLGAIRVAGSKSDSLASGWLYQWGRPADGHENRSSPKSIGDDLSNDDVPGHGKFIVVTAAPFDWKSPQNDMLWANESSENNPCPPGFRLPTVLELQSEVDSWPSKDAEGAFESPLRWTITGIRDRMGIVKLEGDWSRYWASDAGGGRASGIELIPTGVAISTVFQRASGAAVRCIKD